MIVWILKTFLLLSLEHFLHYPILMDLSIIRKQIVRSATSVAANYRAVSRARSEKEKFAKIYIVVEEIDETQLWLEIIEELEYVNPEKNSIFKNRM